MKSLLEHTVYLRNLCAHHSRLWNRRFTITLALPTTQPMAILSSLHPAEDRRIYNTLVLLQHLVDVIDPANTWGRRLHDLIASQPSMVTPHMGFPSAWRTRPVWSRFS
jgi:abortive infection bacteriophage resistance protein